MRAMDRMTARPPECKARAREEHRGAGLTASARRGRGNTTNARACRKQKKVKGKQDRFHLLPFISFYFPELGLFNGLRAKKIKKFHCLSGLALKLWSWTFQTATAPRRPAG
jgi:hypothetical protein